MPKARALSDTRWLRAAARSRGKPYLAASISFRLPSGAWGAPRSSSKAWWVTLTASAWSKLLRARRNC